MRSRLTRRLVLKGASGAALALPFLESVGCTSSGDVVSAPGVRRQALTFPKRVIFFYTPNGNLELPATMDFTGSVLEPLMPFRNKMVLIKGLDLLANDEGPGEPHQQGMAMLTGKKLNSGSQIGGDGSLSGWASGISVDQVIGAELGKNNRFKTLNVGVQSTQYGGTEVRTVLSYTGSDQPIANETSPYALYSRLFSQFGADLNTINLERNRRHSVLSYVKSRFGAITPKLSAHDRQKLEQHLESVNEVDKRLDNPDAIPGGFCAKPEVGAPLNLTDPANYGHIGTLQMDLVSMALACDLTRVVTLQWSASTNNRPYPFLSYDDGSGLKPIADDEHILGHQPYTDVHAWGKLRVIRRWYMAQLAYLMTKLDAVKEGSGTMLDNTAIVWCSEITSGNTHSHHDAPFMLAGGAGGAWETNRILQFDGDVPHNNLLVSLLNGMGVAASTFGEAAHCTGPLAGLI